MKKRILTLSLLFLLVFPAISLAQSKIDITNACKNYSIESAVRFIDMAKTAEKGILPGDKEWRELFATDGYHHFFAVCGDSLRWQRNIRTAFHTVFDKSQQVKLDSILSRPVNMYMSQEGFMVINFQQLKSQTDSLYNFLHHTNFSEMMQKAHLKAQLFLPSRINELKPAFKEFYFLAWDLESRAWDDNTYFDINSFHSEGPEGMINLMAHELHHLYMSALIADRYKCGTNDDAFYAISVMQQEGTADLINKQKMPVDKLGAYGADLVKMYNDDYFSSPEVLKQLDNLTTDYLAGKITKEQYRATRQCAHFGGHTTGDYMVFLIRDQLGLQAVIDCFPNFSAFVHRYNEAATKAGTYVFSDTFVQHIDKICSEMERN